jgi:hypothetical protein
MVLLPFELLGLVSIMRSNASVSTDTSDKSGDTDKGLPLPPSGGHSQQIRHRLPPPPPPTPGPAPPFFFVLSTTSIHLLSTPLLPISFSTTSL